MSMNSRDAVLLAVGASAALALVIGSWCARRARTSEDFHLAGRSLGAWRAALSQAAGAYGVWIPIGVSGAAYVLGFAAVWIGAGILAGAALNWFYVGAAIHEQSRLQGATTSFELLGGADPPGSMRSTAQAAAGIAAVAVFFGLCVQLGIAGSAVARGLAVPHPAGVLVVAAVALLGALLGGLRAVTAFGVLGALVIAAAAVCLPIPVLLFLGGMSGLSSALAVTGPSALDPLAGHAGTQAALFVLGSLGIGLGLCGQPQLADQFIAMRSTRTVRWAGLIAIAWFAIVLLGMLLLGWEARAFYESIDSGDVVIFEIVQRTMPPALAALPVLAVFVAAIVALGAQLLIVSDALVLLASRTDSNGPSVARLRVVALLAGGAAAAIAAVVTPGSARVALLCWLATAAVLGPLFLVRAWGVRIRSAYAAAAMRVGITLTLVLYLLRRERTEWLAAFVPFALALTLAILGRERRSRPQA